MPVAADLGFKVWDPASELPARVLLKIRPCCVTSASVSGLQVRDLLIIKPCVVP